MPNFLINMLYLTEKLFSLGILKKSYSCFSTTQQILKKNHSVYNAATLTLFSEHYEVKS